MLFECVARISCICISEASGRDFDIASVLADEGREVAAIEATFLKSLYLTRVLEARLQAASEQVHSAMAINPRICFLPHMHGQNVSSHKRHASSGGCRLVVFKLQSFEMHK